jgi:hypothetical protein
MFGGGGWGAEHYSIFILPYHMLEVVMFTTQIYESGVASYDKLPKLS